MSLQFVVDGYNLIRHASYSRRGGSGDEKNALLDFIRREHVCGSLKNTVTVVFDGFPGPWKAREECFRVVFSGSATADEIIGRITRSSGNPASVVVVSDDREVRVAARQDGAAVLSIEEFVSRSLSERRRVETARLSYQDSVKTDLPYIQMQKINKELTERWLGKKEGKKNR